MRRILLVALSSETQSLHRRETASSIERPGGCEVSPLLFDRCRLWGSRPIAASLIERPAARLSPFHSSTPVIRAQSSRKEQRATAAPELRSCRQRDQRDCRAIERSRARQKCRAKDDKDVRSLWPPSYSPHVIRLLRCPSLDWQLSQDYVAADLLPAELILQDKPLFHVPCNGDCSLTVHLRVHGKIAA